MGQPVRQLDRVWRIPGAVVTTRPEAARLLDAANVRAWQVVAPPLLEQLRLTVATLIGNDSGLRRRSTTARQLGLSAAKLAHLREHTAHDGFTAAEGAALTFAEQFVLDVGGMPADYVAALERHLPPGGVRAFVEALYVTECTQRLEMMVPRLVGDPPDGGGSQHAPAVDVRATSTSQPAADELRESLREYQNAVMRGRDLDPVVTELVRLRCARTHDCRICKTLRLSDARAAGVDDTMTAKVDFYERSDLDDRAKTALRITDAFITRPDTLGDAVVSRARATFSPRELVELCLDITKWSTQKVHVSLGLDGAEALPTSEEGVSFFGFAEDGRVTGYTADAPPAR